MHAIFYQFSDAENGGGCQQPNVLAQLVTGEPQHTGLELVTLSVSNTTLFSIVFFACDVRKLNYIKNDFV